MNINSDYKKVASYEAEIGEVRKVVMLYSGGLDTSVMLKWLKDTYKVEVITLTLNIGQQGDDLEKIKEKALRLGALKAFIVDAQDEFAQDYLSVGIKANASYQNDYHLSTPLGRPLMAKWAVKIAEQEGADAIAHGCTGKGNDQVRIEGAILSYNSKMKIIAPIREWNMDRAEEIEYAIKHNIPVPTRVDFPYSDDDNMWGMTWEGGEIEVPSLVAPVEKFLTTYTLPKNAPDEPEIVTISFKKGVPTKLNGQEMKLVELIKKLNIIAGKHGVGIIHLLEDRLVGVKSRGVYEMPAAHTIIEAHKALEKYTATRSLNELKEIMDIKWSYLCYAGLWFDQAVRAINVFNDFINEKVEGEVKVELFKGHLSVIALESPYGLDYASFNNAEGLKFNVNASPGFTEIFTLQSRLSEAKNKKS